MDLNKNDQAGSTANGGGMHSFFRKLWKINTPHKVRHNAWRAAQNILSTKPNWFIVMFSWMILVKSVY